VVTYSLVAEAGVVVKVAEGGKAAEVRVEVVAV